MKSSEISRVLGRYFFYLAAILLIPCSVALIDEFIIEKKFYFSTPATFAFLETIAITLLCGFFFQWRGQGAHRPLYRKESILVVALIWFFTAGIGACPFLLTGALKSPVDAYFESMSGLTTTGATILYPKTYSETGAEIPSMIRHPLDPSMIYTFYGTIAPMKDPSTGEAVKIGVEALGKPLLFWRTFMEWLGGMGIVVLFIAVLPALAMGGKFLFENEVPGLSKEGMTPRIKETASILWKIYLALTLVQTALLMLTNSSISLFDAVTLSFSTISTGGFTVSNLGLQAYSNITHWVIVFFMLLGSLNFTLYFHCLKGKFYRLYEPEFFLYLMILAGGCLLISLNLWNSPHFGTSSRFSLIEALKEGSFMAVSAQTSTGFSIASYDLWPFSCQILMVILMFIGGMSGSTTGGIKVIRYFITLKAIKNKIETLFRPEVVRVMKIGHREIASKTVMTVLTLFCIVILFVGLGTYLLVLDHQDPITSIGIISCMMNNTGLNLGGLGITGSYAFLTCFSKIVCIFWMVLGRLEYLSLLVLFAPAFWSKK